MSSLNNFQASNIRRTPFVPSLNNSILASNAPSVQQSNQLGSTSSIMDVFSTPVQPGTHITKMSVLQSPMLNTTAPKLEGHIGNNSSSNLRLEPGFVSSNSTGRLSALVPTPSYSNPSLNMSSYTPANPRVPPGATTGLGSSTGIPGNGGLSATPAPIKHYHSNSYGHGGSNMNLTVNTNLPAGSTTNTTATSSSNNNNSGTNVSQNYHSHSRYPSDVTDHPQQHEPYDHPNFILNTPERALLTLPNPIQLPHSYMHQPKSMNQFSPYESVPSSLNSHVHSISLDTVTSNYSTKSISNDEWYNNTNAPSNTHTSNNYSHKHTYSNTSSIHTTSNDDASLMDLAREYAELSLEDLSSQVKEIEREISDSTYSIRNPKENRGLQILRKKQQQLFALVTLIKTVKIIDNSVCPRNIVYSRYVDICKKYGVTQVCNAAFGKLVKVFYPGIKTRRLGVRGSSRYNYCGIEMIDNNYTLESEDWDNDSSMKKSNLKPLAEAIADATPNIGSNINENDIGEDEDENMEHNKSNDKVDEFEVDFDIIPDGNNNNQLDGKPNDPSADGISGANRSRLVFDDLFTKSDMNDEFQPDFYSIINSPEIKRSHKAIIRSYCDFLMLIFSDWRYLKIESLFNKLDTFDFENRLSEEDNVVYEMEYEELAPSINLCNLEAYKSAIKLISKIVYQQVPEDVQTALGSFEKSYLIHVQNMNIKKCISDENLKIASKFINIVSILRKVVFLSSSAAKLLSYKETKVTFCKEWDSLNIPILISTHPLLPEISNSDLINIQKISQYLGNIFKSLGYKENGIRELSVGNYRDNIIRKLSVAFASIPLKFPHIEPRNLLMYIDAICSKILRELTVENCTSTFSVWWSLVCWCNEYMLLIAETGGFLN